MGIPGRLALTLTYYFDFRRCFPLSDCAWFVCSGVPKGFLNAKAPIGFTAGVATEGRRILSLRHAPEPNNVTLCRAFPKTEPGKPLVWLTTNDNNFSRKMKEASAGPWERILWAERAHRPEQRESVDVYGRSLEGATTGWRWCRPQYKEQCTCWWWTILSSL